MMKMLRVFGVFILLHVAGWIGAHFYAVQNPQNVLLVVDTSYSMKPKFSEMGAWIDDFADSARYQTIRVGTDKAMLGDLANLKARSVIFRTAFGRMTDESLNRYKGSVAKEKILLSDGSVQPEGWQVVEF